MLNEGKGKGYIGKSMSVNAKIAYNNEEAPLSKWTKKVLVEIIDDFINLEDLNLDISLIKKVNLKDLRYYFLRYTSYHHTGSFYNATDFYELDENYILNLTNIDVQKIIDAHKKHLEDTKEERAKEREINKERAMTNRKKRKYKAHVGSLLQYSNYKTLNGLLKGLESGRVDIGVLEKKQAQFEKERTENNLKSELGQLRKYTFYKNVDEMLEAVNNNKLSLKELRSMAK